MLRLRYILAAFALMICCATASPPAFAQAQDNLSNFGNKLVQVEVQDPPTAAPVAAPIPASGCNPSPGTVSGCYQAPTDTTTTATATIPPVPTAPNLNLTQGTFATLAA